MSRCLQMYSLAATTCIAWPYRSIHLLYPFWSLSEWKGGRGHKYLCNFFIWKNSYFFRACYGKRRFRPTRGRCQKWNITINKCAIDCHICWYFIRAIYHDVSSLKSQVSCHQVYPLYRWVDRVQGGWSVLKCVLKGLSGWIFNVCYVTKAVYM